MLLEIDEIECDLEELDDEHYSGGGGGTIDTAKNNNNNNNITESFIT